MEYFTDVLMKDGDFPVDNSGDLILTSDRESLLQDLRNELTSFDGDLFDAEDGEYGYELQEFINLEADEINRLELEQRLLTKLKASECINPDEIIIEITKWDYSGITMTASFEFLSQDERLLILIEKGLVTIEEG